LTNGYIRLGDTELATAGALGGGARASLPAHRRGVVLLSQAPHVFGYLTVRQNVEYGPRAHGLPRPHVEAKARELIDRLDLADLADRPGHALSGGQAQRVALARTMAVEPRLLLLDEPFAALDVTTAAELRQTLADLLAERGTTTVFISHSVLDVVALATRVLVLEDGRVTDDGPPDRVLWHPQPGFAAELAGVAVLSGRVGDRGFVTDQGWALPLPRDASHGRPDATARLFVPPEAVTVARPDESTGAWTPVRVVSVTAAPVGVAVVVTPPNDASASGVRLFVTTTYAWLTPGQLVRIRLDAAKISVEMTED
jgi:molybdate transport system ATP-binding protein